MEVASKYTRMFVSDSLTNEKYNELLTYAVHLRDMRNEVSAHVNAHLLDYVDTPALQFVTLMRERYSISSNFDKHLYRLVIDCYRNKYEAIKKKLEFHTTELLGFERYKRDCKNGRKGELKNVRYNKVKTLLSMCLTYLARYGNASTVEYIKSQLAEPGLNEKRREFYAGILSCIEKFTFRRLMTLAIQRRERFLRRYFAKPIEFKSLTFSGRSRKKVILGENKNRGSVIRAFINLSWEGRESLDVPVKYASDYHGRFEEYEKKTNDYEYVVTFNQKHRRVSFNLVKDGMRYLPKVTDTDTVVGIDVNVKHNLFTLSDGTSYDYDRGLLKEYCRLCVATDRLKAKDKEYTVGRKRQYRIEAVRRRILSSERTLIASMCRTLRGKGVRHIVMEDLKAFGKTHVKSGDNESLNFNRIVRALHLTDIKNEVDHIARKYDIAVSLVQSEYTSKMCPVCGCIEDENRLTQEDFCCVRCGHKDNADHNAAVNIRNRVLEAVRKDLLKQNDNGSWSPRPLNREKVKARLLKSSAVQDTSVKRCQGH